MIKNVPEDRFGFSCNEEEKDRQSFSGKTAWSFSTTKNSSKCCGKW